MSKMSTGEAAKLLGIDMATNPSPEEVKKAYRKEALIWCETNEDIRPGGNPGANGWFL